MNSKEFDQVKSYSHLIVALMHSSIDDDRIYRRFKSALKVAEELEMFMFQIDKARKARDSNIFQLKRIA